MAKKISPVVIILLFSGFLFFFGLGRMPLTDPDEPFYAETAKEMFERNEWLTPLIFGQPQFEKPPFYYWTIILSYKIFGINEFSSRLSSALFGILGILGIYFLGRVLFTEKTGLYSAVSMAISIEYIILARACVTDMALSVFITFTFLFYLMGYMKGHRKLFYILSACFAALAVLTKGPVGLVLPVAVVGLYLIFKKDLKSLIKFPFVSGGLVFILVALPWYYMMYKAHGTDFTGHFFGFQNITRFLHPEHRSGDVFYYYLPIILGGFYPCSIFLPYGGYKLRKDYRLNTAPYLFLIIWISVFLVFFSVSRTKLPTYIFPLFPALAVIIGRFLDINFQSVKFEKPEIVSAIIFLFSLPVGLVVFYALALRKYPLMVPAILNTGVSVLIFVAISMVCLLKKKKGLFYGSIVLVMTSVLASLVIFLSVPIGQYESSRYFADEIRARMGPRDRIGGETDYQRGLAFYLGREDVVDIHPHHIMTSFFDSTERVWGVIKEKNHVFLYTDKRQPFWRPTYVLYKFGKKVLVTNIIPEDGKYIKKRSIDEPF